MIYDYPRQEDTIKQGDIFVGIPRMDISLKRIPVLTEDEELEETTWKEIVDNDDVVTAIIPVKPVKAIVISQDCDAARMPDINLCEIREFRDVEGICKDTKNPQGWVKVITQHARKNQKWFYLPPDPIIGFNLKMGVDFLITLRLPRTDLEDFRHFRKGRLNEIAEAHFRERIAEFFRRYPYNEWYSLNHEEMKIYQKNHPDSEPYPWQSTTKVSE